MGSDSLPSFASEYFLSIVSIYGSLTFSRGSFKKKKKLEKNQRKVNKTVKEKRKPTGTRLLFCAWHYEC